MLLTIQANDDRPIYLQIVQQVKYAVAAGVLAPGVRVPSVRDLARQLVVNPNTVARAYRDLQTEGVLQPVRGTGLEITSAATKRCRDDRRELVRQRLRSALEEARHSGLEAHEVEHLVKQEFKRVNGRAVSGDKP